ncbi:MAG: T9SS type A sorting domain-containing protein [Sphingobacteriaceae bacterium]|nr:T9SS type A sorting domain-containing protein [Sphingobacteriaceae bacterium]
MKPSISQVAPAGILRAAVQKISQKLRMGAMIAALLMLWSGVALGSNLLQVEVALKNAFRDGDRYYFDLYLSQVGPVPVLLAFSDLVFDLQPNNAFMSLHYVAGSAQLQSASGLPVVYNEQFDVQLLNRNGQMIAMINADAPLNVQASNYQYKVAQIDARPMQHRLGRFYLANFRGQLNDFSIQMRLNAAGSNSKMYGFNPAMNFQAEVVELLYSKPEAGEQQALRSIQAEMQGNAVAVVWESAYERDLLNFRLMKSFDGQNWMLVKEVAAQNAQQARELYRVQDVAPVKGQAAVKGAVYYKLQANGQNGLQIESPAKLVVLSQAISFNVYPNPAREQVQVRLAEHSQLQNYELRIYDSAGRLVFQRQQEGLDQPAIDLYNFASGVYFVQVQSGKQHSANRLVVLK